MFLSRFLKSLQDPKQRQEALERTIEETRALYERGAPPDQSREPLLRLQDQFDEVGTDRMELLSAACEAFPEDSYWIAAIGTLLLSRKSLGLRELDYLLLYGEKVPRHLETWTRLFREARAHGETEFHSRARERCALALLPFFPNARESFWEGGGALEDQAHRLFLLCLKDAAEAVAHSRRSDDTARQLLTAAFRHLPERGDLRHYLAELIAARNSRSPEDIAVVMETLVENPDDIGLKLWVAEALLELPGHAAEGMGMLRQLHQDAPEWEPVQDALVEALRKGEEPGPADLPVLKKWCEAHPEDARALEVLADVYAGTRDTRPEALEVYRRAAVSSGRRMTYLRLLGEASVTKSNWDDVISIFEDLKDGGEEGEDVVIPLAMAYASTGRRDKAALEVCRRAIDLGTKRPEVHDFYCQYIYTKAPGAPESVTHYAQTLEHCPQSKWARIGMVHHYLDAKDHARALEGALELLKDQPRDIQALDMAGTALARDFSHRQLARLAPVEPRTLHGLFEKAHELVPDAGPIVLGLVRSRLAENMRDARTASLLRDACRHFPDMVDLRIERADLLWDMEQKENAMEIYRDLLARWRTGLSARLPKGVTPETRRRILFRAARRCLETPEEEDLELLLEAGAEPDAAPDLVLGAARSMIGLQVNHPAGLPLLEKALRIAPEDAALERAWAEAMAARGKPTPAVRLAARMVEHSKSWEQVTSLLRAAHAASSPAELPPSVLNSLRDAFLRTTLSNPPAILAAVELIASVRPIEAGDVPLLDWLAEALPKNVRVRRWLARGLADSGDDSRAADVYGSLIDSETYDSQVVIELARTHARLNMRDKGNLRVAEEAVNLCPDDPELLLHLAGIELDLGHVATAAGQLDKVLREAPELHPRVLSLVQSTPMLETDSRRILPLLARVHVMACQYETALGILAGMLANYQHHFADMMDLYDRLVYALPENPRPRIERAILYRLAGQLDEAIADLKAAHELAPSSQDILREYADVLSQKARTAHHRDPALCVSTGEIFLQLGDEQTAREMALLAIDAKPDCDPAFRLKARAELNIGCLADCHGSLRHMKDKAPALEVFEQLSRAYAERREHMLAAEVLTDCIEVAGARRELLERLRRLHRQHERESSDATQHQRVLVELSERARNRYELREELGSGSMGVVYKAYDRELDEIVVLKILPEGIGDDPQVLSQFRHEAKAARKLAHPNIIRIHDFGEEAGRKHISMEYVSGGDLRNMLDRGEDIPPEERVRIVREVLLGLRHAHSEGVIHRDIKMANILLTASRRVKLSDFGIASLVQVESPDPTRDTQYLFGTPTYMSPEQFRDEPVTPATDLYSVGVMMYELFHGEPPFTRGSLSYHHQFTEPEQPEELPEALWQVVERLLRKDPAERFQSAGEVLEALDAATGGSAS